MRLSDKEIRQITRLIDSGKNNTQISRATGRGRPLIREIRYGIRPVKGWTPQAPPEDDQTYVEYMPTPEQIREACLEIRSGWSESVWKQRSGWGEENERACLRGIGFASIGKNRYVVVS